MKSKTLRKWNRIIHRDFGYFFFGMTLIYAISGIALNHIKDWNPSFIITSYETRVDIPENKDDISKKTVLNLLEALNIDSKYKKHYFPDKEHLKIFINSGNILININSSIAQVELLRKRPILNEFNYLHYNPRQWWTWFADIFGGALIVLAVTGLFIIKGKNGITGRGAWLTIAGIVIPLIFLFFFKK